MDVSTEFEFVRLAFRRSCGFAFVLEFTVSYLLALESLVISLGCHMLIVPARRAVDSEIPKMFAWVEKVVIWDHQASLINRSFREAENLAEHLYRRLCF